jgi:hypothetical protein
MGILAILVAWLIAVFNSGPTIKPGDVVYNQETGECAVVVRAGHDGLWFDVYKVQVEQWHQKNSTPTIKKEK